MGRARDVPGQQFFDAVDRVIGDTREDFKQIRFRIDTFKLPGDAPAVSSKRDVVTAETVFKFLQSDYAAIIRAVGYIGMSVAQKQRVRFGPFELDVRTEELYKNGRKLKLQPQPIRVLAILLEKPGELVTREEIHRRLWPADTFVDFEHGLNTAIKKLRMALSDETETPKYVETLPRRGYRFVSKLEDAPQRPQATLAVEFPLAPNIESLESMRDSLIAPRWNPVRMSPFTWVLAVAGILTLAFGASFLFTQLFPPPPRIVATRQLTHTRLQKSSDMGCYLATDGVRVYFVERRGGDEWFISQVSVTGGETTDLPAQVPSPRIFGCWRSGTELLVANCCPKRLWTVPLPAGTPRLLDIPSGTTFLGAMWFAPVPDASGVVYALNGEKEMHRLTLRDNSSRKLFSAPDIRYTHVSPDGNRIRWTVMTGAASKFKAEVWEAGIDGENPHPLSLAADVKGDVSSGDWTRDGQLFFFFRLEEHRSTLWARREHRLFPWIKSKPTLLYAGPLELHSPVASRDSKELYAVGADLRGELSVYEPRSSSFVPFLGGIPASYVNFSHDRRWITYVSYPDGDLWKSRIDGSEKQQLTFGMGVFVPRWSPDDKSIVFAARRSPRPSNTTSSIYLVPAAGGQPLLLETGQQVAGDPTWSPDGNSIAYGGDWTADTKVRILDLKTMQSREVPGSDGLFSPRWSPDGRYIVAHFYDVKRPKLMLYSFAENRWRSLLTGDWVGWEAWSHDGRYVYVCDSTNRIIRIDIANGDLETAATLGSVLWATSGFRTGGWFDLTPDDRIMILRNTGTEEVYALKLEY